MHADNGTGKRLWEVFGVALGLGCTSFGGPVAHIGFFRRAYVEKRQWLTDRQFLELVGLCQALPGPSSSQLGMAIGNLRAGYLGGWLAWLGFTLPSAVLMAVFFLVWQAYGDVLGNLGHSLKLLAWAVVLQAVWGLGRANLVRLELGLCAVVSLGVCLLWQSPWITIALMAVASAWGAVRAGAAATSLPSPSPVTGKRRMAVAHLVVFAGLFVGLTLLAQTGSSRWVAWMEQWFRAGALVFGGGHVVLPLLENAFVQPGGLSHDVFLAGYGATQTMPGPLFSFAAFLGMALGGVGGAAVATLCLFLPGILLLQGVLPFWDRLRNMPRVPAALHWNNAVVVGLLAATWISPMTRLSLTSLGDIVLGTVLVALLFSRKVPLLLVAAVAVLGGTLLPLWGG